MNRLTALSLMAVACLAFLLALLLFGGAQGTLRIAGTAEPKRNIQGGDEPTRTALELLPGELVDLNTATAEELQKLPGIGTALSRAIVDYREEHGPFHSVEELLEVRGIGEGRLSGIRDLVTVGP